MTTLASLRAQVAELARRTRRPAVDRIANLTTGELRAELAQLLEKGGIDPMVLSTPEGRAEFMAAIRERLGQIARAEA